MHTKSINYAYLIIQLPYICARFSALRRCFIFMAEPSVTNDAYHLPALVDVHSLLHQSPLDKCHRCKKPLGALTKMKHCRECLDYDLARKQGLTVDELQQNRLSAEKKKAALISEGMIRAPPPVGYHYCHPCRKDQPDADFDLTKSNVSRCKTHHASLLAAKQKANAVAPPSSASPRSVVHSEKTFSTIEAALEYLEILGHSENVMYNKESEHLGSSIWRCHCAVKQRDRCPGMYCSLSLYLWVWFCCLSCSPNQLLLC